MAGTNLANYTVVYVNGTLTVGQATLTVTATNATRAYGAANPTFTGTYTGAQGTRYLHGLGQHHRHRHLAGRDLHHHPHGGGHQPANYTVVYVNGTLTVGQATLTVTATNATRAYGAANPTFTGPYTGAQGNGDTFTVSGSTTATATSPVGTYTITPTVAGTNLGELHRGLCQRHPDRRPGHPDGDRDERHPRLRGGEPDLHGTYDRGVRAATPSRSRAAPPPPQPRRSGLTPSPPRWRAPTWRTTPWSMSTAP